MPLSTQPQWQSSIPLICLHMTGPIRSCCLQFKCAAAHLKLTCLHRCATQVYTFGTPYVGDHEFARDYEACVPDTWHIINDRDVITRLGKFFCLFKRPGWVVPPAAVCCVQIGEM